MTKKRDSREAVRLSTWRSFLASLFLSLVLAGGGLYFTILMIDPFDSLAISPPLARVPVDSNQRFSYPALARSDKFDSAVFGTSTSRLLEPARLNPLFDARFANLAMNSATAYEQSRLIDLFVRYHPDARVVLLGVDIVWCHAGDDLERFTERPFPEWLYDGNAWNDYLAHFNFHAAEQAGRQAATLLGLRPIKRGLDGYTNFLPDDADYDLARAKEKLWRGRAPVIAPVEPPTALSEDARRSLNFPALPFLEETLDGLPRETLAVLFFVPYHVSQLPAPNSEGESLWNECKARIAELVERRSNSLLIDFMRPSDITRNDANYWDQLHYRVAVADRLADLLHQSVFERDLAGPFTVLAANLSARNADHDR